MCIPDDFKDLSILAGTKGELNVKGRVWDFKSVSGDILVGVAREFKYEIDAVTHSGRIQTHNEA
jgi:hypothetical protein